MSVMCYNEKRDTQVMVPAALPEQFDALAAAVEAKGVRVHNSTRGVKAYFTARFIEGGEVLLVDTSAAVEPPPAW